MLKTIYGEKYLNRIRPFIGMDIIKVLIGCRRVGKTTILLQLADEIVGSNYQGIKHTSIREFLTKF